MILQQLIADQVETANRVYELATSPTDNYAPNYYRYPDALSLLIHTTAQLELMLKRFNKRQVEGIEQRFNLANVSFLQLDQFDDLGVFVEFVWQQDIDDLSGIFASLMPQAIAAGGLMSQQELGFEIDFNPADLPAQKFLERHVPKLAKDITDTTRDRVKNSIRQSLLAGESRDDLVKRLGDVIDSEPRRRMIAQTESVQAFSEGRIQAGIEMGATEKKWRAQIERCPICDDLHGRTAPLAGYFEGKYGKFYGSPAHPHCRCGIELSFGAKNDTASIQQYRSDYLKSLRDRF